MVSSRIVRGLGSVCSTGGLFQSGPWPRTPPSSLASFSPWVPAAHTQHHHGPTVHLLTFLCWGAAAICAATSACPAGVSPCHLPRTPPPHRHPVDLILLEQVERLRNFCRLGWPGSSQNPEPVCLSPPPAWPSTQYQTLLCRHTLFSEWTGRCPAWGLHRSSGSFPSGVAV